MTTYPAGTVAFLFTDVEGSVGLWERYPEAMHAAYARHDAILRGAAAAHGGVVYKVVGDAFQAAFPDAAGAVAAALEAQRSLGSGAWPIPEPLRVRMVLHAGAVEPNADGDYRSPVLNRAGRLLGVGHGGQVLLSRAAADAARGGLPSGVDLHDLGEHLLRGLPAEHVFQFVAAGLGTDFPPLTAARPHNLPAAPTGLVGRDDVLAELVSLMRRPAGEGGARLVTLTGPGGVGKTRLGIETARALLSAPEVTGDGAFLVPLAALGDPGLVAGAIARPLGIQEEPGRALVETLTERLRDKAPLLVLDNFEHLLPAAPLVAELMAGCPGLRVLATSRAPLRLRGEREVPVVPLPVPKVDGAGGDTNMAESPAVRLFVERARDVRPEFALTEANAGDVAAICRRLDGLPLAVELAAARVRLLPPAALLTRLERRLPLLTGGARDLPTRQRTLSATIAWSHGLLTPADQALFRQLAVFAGGCTAEAVEAVAGFSADADAFDGLASLVDNSLVQRSTDDGDEPRFRLLETVREYGLERLEASGEAAEARRRHASYYLALTERAEPELFGPAQQDWLDRLESEHDNLRSALAWAVEADGRTALRLVDALVWFWIPRGYLVEGRGWAAQALARAAAAPARDRAVAVDAASNFAYVQGDYDQARVLAEEGLSLAQEAGDARRVIAALISLGNAASDQGDLDQGSACFEEALVLARRTDHAFGISTSLNNLGVNASIRGDLSRASELFADGLEAARARGNGVDVARALVNLGEMSALRGDGATAAGWLRDGLVESSALGHRELIAGCLWELAVLAAASGHAERAARGLGAAEGLRELIDIVLPPYSRSRNEQVVATVRAALREETAAAAWAAGRALSLDEAVAEGRALAEALAFAKAKAINLTIPVSTVKHSKGTYS